jgi:hypothetical protein
LEQAGEKLAGGLLIHLVPHTNKQDIGRIIPDVWLGGALFDEVVMSSDRGLNCCRNSVPFDVSNVLCSESGLPA